MNAIENLAPPRRTAVVVIGAGQAGLACSYYLSRFGVEHVILERGQLGNSWQTERWDSLRLLPPNWQSTLPGAGYAGDAPDRFMDMPEVLGMLSRYARQFSAPVEEYTPVTRVRSWGDGYRVSTTRGDWYCMALVLASGAFNQAIVPEFASSLPRCIAQFTTQTYRNPGQLGQGRTLVVGAAASGVQIAEEIQRSGRQITLAVGEHVRMPRRYRDRDIQHWMHACGLLTESWQQVDDLIRVRRLQFYGGLKNITRLADLKLNRLLDTIDHWINAHPAKAAAQRRNHRSTGCLPDGPALHAAQAVEFYRRCRGGCQGYLPSSADLPRTTGGVVYRERYLKRTIDTGMYYRYRPL